MKPFFITLLTATALCLTSGCAVNSFTSPFTTVPAYQPANVFRDAEQLPKDIKRVAVLPLTATGAEADTEFGREVIGPLLVEELGLARKFELVAVSPEQLRRWTGRSHWSGDEILPPDFFAKLRGALACDAVVFCRLTQYRAYPPLAVGWRLKLIETEEPHLLWSGDEVFDAREPGVAEAARRHARTQPVAAPSVADASTILVSPRRFAQYAARATFATLPAR